MQKITKTATVGAESSRYSDRQIFQFGRSWNGVPEKTSSSSCSACSRKLSTTALISAEVLDDEA